MIKILYPEPALILNSEDEKYIVISDLHIGFEERFNKQGISIQSSIEKMQEVWSSFTNKIKEDGMKTLSFLMGIAMNEVRGKTSGSLVNELLCKKIKYIIK